MVDIFHGVNTRVSKYLTPAKPQSVYIVEHCSEKDRVALCHAQRLKARILKGRYRVFKIFNYNGTRREEWGYCASKQAIRPIVFRDLKKHSNCVNSCIRPTAWIKKTSFMSSNSAAINIWRPMIWKKILWRKYRSSTWKEARCCCRGHLTWFYRLDSQPEFLTISARALSMHFLISSPPTDHFGLMKPSVWSSIRSRLSIWSEKAIQERIAQALPAVNTKINYSNVYDR